MKPTPASPTPEEEEPFVREECGDTMWDAVLEPSAPVPALPAPASPKEEGRDPEQK